MDSWVTDRFYSHFPSYSGERSRRKLLDKDRQDEYNRYLSRLASAEKANDKHATSRRNHNAGSNQECQTERDEPSSLDAHREKDVFVERNAHEKHERELSREKFLNDLQNLDLPDIFNDEIIKQRNRRIAEEQQYQKLKYQRDLLAQIEQKRMEAELRKAKEIEDDDRLTRKMEEQLRSVRLQDEIEKAALARKRDYRNLRMAPSCDPSTSPKSNKYQQMLASNRNSYKSPRRNRHTDRSTEPANGKENLPTAKKIDDREIYKYFTNSARDSMDVRNISFRSHRDHGNEDGLFETMDSHRCHTYPLKKNRANDAGHACGRCELDAKRVACNFCEQNRLLRRSEYDDWPAHERNSVLCKTCYLQSICACCREEICARCSRPTKHSENIVHKPKTKAVTERSPRRRKLSPTKLALLEESYEDSSDDDDEDHVRHNYIDLTSSRLSSPRKVQADGKPYSFNIDKSSVFHPSNASIDQQIAATAIASKIDAEETDELKRITAEKLSKYARNYGDMRTKNSSRSKMIEMDPYLMQEYRKSGSESNSVAIKQLESRWQIPFTQRDAEAAADSDKRVCIMTQSGAFKKQLQMDKFNFNFNRSDDDDSTFK